MAAMSRPALDVGCQGVEVLAQLVHAAMVADFGHHLIAATQEPVEDLGGPKAPIQAEHNLGPTFTAPSQMGFDLQQRGLGGAQRSPPPEQRLMEYLLILARRDPKGLPTGFTPIAPPPGPLTASALAPIGIGVRSISTHNRVSWKRWRGVAP